ncbi:hypothetical protein QQF64_001586 [Cirrhinus molitorella]|uniref:Uncharacterized protein n=1 Tax=Cirrhinus molitorella TaxID=172907 RepID=A0ABR3P0J3_9TELE
MARWRKRWKVEGEKERDYGKEPDTTQAVRSSHQKERPPLQSGITHRSNVNLIGGSGGNALTFFVLSFTSLPANQPLRSDTFRLFIKEKKNRKEIFLNDDYVI